MWAELLGSIGRVRSIFSDNEVIAKSLRKFVLELVSPAAEKVGWEFPPGEGFLAIQLRTLLIGSACRAGHEK